VKRRLELSSVYNRKFNIQRAEVKDPKLIGLWFKLVGDTIKKYGVVGEDIFNFDKCHGQNVTAPDGCLRHTDQLGR
jgi:hypothetical protein